MFLRPSLRKDLRMFSSPYPTFAAHFSYSVMARLELDVLIQMAPASLIKAARRAGRQPVFHALFWWRQFKQRRFLDLALICQGFVARRSARAGLGRRSHPSAASTCLGTATILPSTPVATTDEVVRLQLALAEEQGCSTLWSAEANINFIDKNLIVTSHHQRMAGRHVQTPLLNNAAGMASASSLVWLRAPISIASISASSGLGQRRAARLWRLSLDDRGMRKVTLRPSDAGLITGLILLSNSAPYDTPC